MWETVLVFGIVGAAVVFTCRKAMQSFRGKGKAGGCAGCTGCSLPDPFRNMDSKTKEEAHSASKDV
jgi:hypothetical protein